MASGRFLFVSASLILTGASILVGISFFGPFWLSNVHQADAVDNYILDPQGGNIVSQRPNRGLWAQCGKDCTWFWENGYRLQKEKFTKLKWHLAAQVMYFIAATLMLFNEIFARVFNCCHGENSSCVISAVASIVLISVTLQVATLAVFGGGSAVSPYNAETDPVTITHIIHNDRTGTQLVTTVYLGWCYWVAVAGAIMSLIAGVLFILSACCGKNSCCCHCCDEDSDDCCEGGCCCCCGDDY